MIFTSNKSSVKPLSNRTKTHEYISTPDALPVRLQVENVSWTVDQKRIIDQVLLDVQPGEFVGLLGPNGCGKSTLLRTIYRLLRPDAGLITLNEQNVWQMTAQETAKHTAVVSQERPTQFDFTVYEMVLMGRTPHKGLFDRDSRADFHIVEDALRRVRMLSLAERTFNTLSGGEKQRVLIARALAQQARFLVLDEPTNHLDIRYQLDILTLVRGLNVTTLAALHDLNLAAHYCDRLFMMHEGRIVASGTPEEVLQPDRIREVYQVRAHVEQHQRTGQVQILFTPLELENEPAPLLDS